jgi:hypothetical protein
MLGAERESISELSLSGDEGILELERLQSALVDANEITVKLPTQTRGFFFQESRLAAFISTLLHSDQKVMLRDPLALSEIIRSSEYFSSSLFRLAACYARGHFQDCRTYPIPDGDLRAVFRAVINAGGIAPPAINYSEPPSDDFTRRVAICCFDPNNAEPRFLSGMARNQTRFAERILSVRSKLEQRQYSYVGPGPNRRLLAFLFELYQNGLEHGRFVGVGSDRRPTVGTRFLQITIHTAAKHELLTRATGFPALEEYLDETIRGTEPSTLLEIAVGDAGLGIVEGYFAGIGGKENYLGDTTERLLLHKLLFTDLSSKVGDVKAGKGLPNAMEAARLTWGFISLRSGREWLYRAYSPNKSPEEDPTRLDPVLGSQPLPEIRGAHFNLLFPLA